MLATGLVSLGMLSWSAAVAQTPAEQLMQPGPLPEMSFGPADARVTIVEYASMTCPHCRNFHMNVWPALKAKYVDTGKVRFIMREFPFDPRAAGAFMLARCAGGDKWYATVDLLYRSQETWARSKDPSSAFKSILGMTGMDGPKVEACLSDQALLDKVNAVAERGKQLGVEATPTFFVNGELYKDAYSIEALGSKIDSLLAGKN
ncbi:MAG: DsbA family protein [Aquamicrobium sp.]|nr:DsbA family protein [Aquamicrobium sp.]QAZ43782.1 disulfide bond formation protein DsbA [Mesorhizobium sp. Pch-S]